MPRPSGHGENEGDYPRKKPNCRGADQIRRGVLARPLPLLLICAAIHLSAVNAWAFEASPATP